MEDLSEVVSRIDALLKLEASSANVNKSSLGLFAHAGVGRSKRPSVGSS